MIINLQPGDKLIIGFADENGMPEDGQFEVHFDTKEYPESVAVKESGGLDANIVGKANAILYHEDFSESPDPNDGVVKAE